MAPSCLRMGLDLWSLTKYVLVYPYSTAIHSSHENYSTSLISTIWPEDHGILKIMRPHNYSTKFSTCK